MFEIDMEENMSMELGDSINFAISLNEVDIKKVSIIIMDKNLKYLKEFMSFKKRDIYCLFSLKCNDLNLDSGNYFYRIRVELINGDCFNLFDKRDFIIY